MLQTHELFALLDAQHVHFLSELEIRCLAAMEVGLTTAEIADGLKISEPTVRRHFAELEHKVFDLTGIPPSRGKLATWVRRHFGCCAQNAREMIENDRIFV
jgi:DNA-binding CsgD family transcriptional regulator